ncbi:putative E3 ubiquitin-protein ligase HIP1 [Drosera capensis]
MDRSPSKRTGNGLLVSKMSSRIVSRVSTVNKDQSRRICSRERCSSKLNLVTAPTVGTLEKAKLPRNVICPCASGKGITSSVSVRPSINANSPKRACPELRKKLSSQLGTTDSETSSIMNEYVTSKAIEKTRSPVHPKPAPLASRSSSSPSANSSLSSSKTSSSSSCSSSLNVRVKKQKQPLTLGSQGSSALDSSISRQSDSSKHDASTSTSAVNSSSAIASRHTYMTSRGSLIPVAARSSYSSTENDVGRKRTSEVESDMSVRGKKSTSSSLIDGSRTERLSPDISISNSGSRNFGQRRDKGVVSLTTTRPTAGIRLSNERRLENQLPIRASSNQNHSSCPGRRTDNTRSNRLSAPYGTFRSAVSRNGLRQHNLAAATGVLVALERIDRGGQHSTQELLALETNLRLDSRRAFRDQHSDMRLDIDGMSYEELLALEERMGTVSTGLSEEKLQKCLERNLFYMSSKLGSGDLKGSIDDFICSICQEEYEEGVEMGRLRCEHRYHVGCIQKWLRLKNWCPVCKALVESSSG